jgi:hypothetical protein
MNPTPENSERGNEDFDSIMEKARKRDDNSSTEQEKLVAQAKAENPNKEAFDASKLKQLFNYADLTHTGVESDTPQARKQLEEKYYLDSPEVNSIDEFAEKLKKADSMGGS